MAYSTSNPPKLLVPAFASSGPSLWSYDSTDAATAVDASGYVTNAKDLGIKAGDVVWVTDTDASPPVTTIHRVVAVNTNGSADISDFGASISTNTD